MVKNLINIMLAIIFSCKKTIIAFKYNLSNSPVQRVSYTNNLVLLLIFFLIEIKFRKTFILYKYKINYFRSQNSSNIFARTFSVYKLCNTNRIIIFN